ncbi:MAG: asparagine synthase (glutamine-hydrolyzing) [Candidatus Omnitrophica bacterium]|nr:asparagine synthase (glutamine-hydrolyzing) [Candidatus Omnitrophota bacterium]
MVGAAAEASVVERMTDAQQHRGPDGQGFWAAPGVVLGHRRLKVLDLSDAGRQPMSTPDGRYTIVYNGEVYNYRELRQQLAEVTFRSHTDTEVVLHAYAKWGPACLERFMGMYAFAIWDAQERGLFCARDRVGIKLFYFATLEQGVLFASEIRALLAAGLEPAANERVIFDFLARDFYEHTAETFLTGICKLPPGHWMVVKEGRPGTPRRYWNLASEVRALAVSPDPARREADLLALCEETVRLHLRSDVPIGVALSGGLDSATLLALLDRVHEDPSRVEAFSYVFADPAYSERPYVELMVAQTGHPAHFVEISPQEFAESAEPFCLSQEEPCGGLPVFATARCFEVARQHGCIVMMDGSGIDEALAGYDRFRPALWADLFRAGRLDVLEQELHASGVVTPAARRAALEQMRCAMDPQTEVGTGQDLTRSVRPDCLSPEFVRAAQHPVPEFERPFEDCLRNLMYRELRYTKLPRALRFRDRLSMAVGTELRPPFVDHRLLAYAFALPAEDRIHQGVLKAILRRGARTLLPDGVRLAPKRQVQTPQREWVRHDLQDWVRDHLDTPRFWQRGWVDRKAGLAAMDAFFRGEGDNSFFLWQWVNLELWARLFLDQRLSADLPVMR